MVGKRLHDFLNIAGRIFYETHFAPLLRMQGFFNEVALDLVKKDGEPFPVLVNAAERTDAEGKPQFIRLTVFNATDRRRYERELLKARDELKMLAATLEKRVAEATAEQLRSDTALTSQREEAELREQFIAVLGHDLRNPLASISAGTRLIQKSKLDRTGEAIVIMMQKSVMRMASLIDNVLDFARGRLGGGITLVLSSQPLEPTLQQVVDELQSTHPESIIKTEFALTRPVQADPVRIGQLFSNLLGNALTYGAPGEPVTVTAKTGRAVRACRLQCGQSDHAGRDGAAVLPVLARRGAAEQARAGSWPLHRLRDRQSARRHDRRDIDAGADVLHAEDAAAALTPGPAKGSLERHEAGGRRRWPRRRPARPSHLGVRSSHT